MSSVSCEDIARAWQACNYNRYVITLRVRKMAGWFVDHSTRCHDPTDGDIIASVGVAHWHVHFSRGCGDEEKLRLARLYADNEKAEIVLRLRIGEADIYDKVFAIVSQAPMEPALRLY